ncbi:hypothetical protein [Sporolactobacillus pectinivorans]|nr:hypothetical protein [Sporolactobacillus pectinivorans]
MFRLDLDLRYIAQRTRTFRQEYAHVKSDSGVSGLRSLDLALRKFLKEKQ